MFIDTSAIISIVCREDDHIELLRRARETPRIVTSGLVLLESTMRLSTIFKQEPARSMKAVLDLLSELGSDIIAIDRTDGEEAVTAFARYGKGRGHPAQLNLADCLSYACAKNRNVPLLYKGDDFAQIDLA
ncbi:type II toxin-antitoxin system VapC family toxin [Mesorhizobium sp. CAU 1732]|uniref:type II toxin-antitoxin system VapC family toxin n=1 Tax=Mesorhizobium sp. CAU 1732 TaxID=3140358 RepID=UPI003260FDE5